MTTIAVVTCQDLTNALTAPGAKDCVGGAIDLTTAQIPICSQIMTSTPPAPPGTAGGPVGPATITNPLTGTTIAIPQQVTDCDGAVIDLTNPASQIATCANVDDKIDEALTAPGAKDCAGVAIDLTTAQIPICSQIMTSTPPTQPAVPGGPVGPATITDPLTGTTITIPQQVTDCDGAVIDLTNPASQIATCANVVSAIQSSGAKDCAGSPLDITTAQLAQCSDIAALQAQIAALQAQITAILAALAKTDQIQDCDGNVLMTVIVP